MYSGAKDLLNEFPLVAQTDLQLAEDQSTCRKDLGARGKLRHWSRGHVFIVRSCGHVDTWKPIYK